MSAVIQHKRGDTYRISVALTEDDGITPIDITGWEVRSHIRKRSRLVCNLEYIPVDRINGKYELLCDDTSDWLKGVLTSDIEYTDSNGGVFSTKTYEINCIEDVTYA